MKDLEFHVDVCGNTQVLSTFEKAVETAVIQSIGTGKPIFVDVVVWSKKAAYAFGGSHGVDTYLEDPEASVFQRIEIRANDLGRIA
jgi:hypothetical protein